MRNITKQHVIFAILFVVLAYIALQIPLTGLLGANTKLTIFDALAPTLGGLVSMPVALAALIGVQGVNVVGISLTAVVLVKIITPLFAAFYFSKKNVLQLIIPALAIVAFITSPVGRTVWYYSLFWLIPIACYYLKDTSILARSLGATFTAHAVGGAFWVYLVPLPKAVWISLIPTVAIERLTLAVGMAVFFVLLSRVYESLSLRGSSTTKQSELNNEIASDALAMTQNEK